MKETLELRVLEEHADLLFSPDEGKHLGSGVRLIVLPSSDSRLPQIVKLQRQLRRSRSFFFTAWSYSRKYSAQELASAECSRLTVTAVFEPAGEDCGTVYDESATCPYVFKTGEFTLPGRQAIKYQDWCGVGARQVSDLI